MPAKSITIVWDSVAFLSPLQMYAYSGLREANAPAIMSKSIMRDAGRRFAP